MKMEIYEFNVCTHEGEIAGFNNLETITHTDLPYALLLEK